VRLNKEYRTSPEYSVTPRLRLPYERFINNDPAIMPPLIRGYLRAGAKVSGEPAWDQDFNSADWLLILPMTQVSKRYHRHFLRV
jgi:putative hemolysin